MIVMVNVRRIMPQWMLEIARSIKRGYGRLSAQYWKREIIKNPEKHAKHEMKRQKQVLKRSVNLKEPKYFNEKMLWLKYYLYNDSPLVAQCYNKYEVRKYINSKGLGNILNELYGVWDNTSEIKWEELPEEYIMKISNGYAGHVFKRKGGEFDPIEAKNKLDSTRRKYGYFYYITGDLFAGKTKQKIICEKLLHSDYGYAAPEDYKFHCFNGKPMFLETMKDRNYTKEYAYKELFLDLNLNDRYDLEGEASPGKFDPPKCFDQMIEIAKILSEDFPYVRVDMYVENNKPIFGELTFTPYFNQTENSLTELGDLLDLTDVEKYKPILSHVAE